MSPHSHQGWISFGEWATEVKKAWGVLGGSAPWGWAQGETASGGGGTGVGRRGADQGKGFGPWPRAGLAMGPPLALPGLAACPGRLPPRPYKA